MLKRRRRIKILILPILAYVMCGISGLLAFAVEPSPSLARQGGGFLVYAWASVQLSGCLLGLIGLLKGRVLIEIIGAGCSALTSLLWCVSLVMQAVRTESAAPMSAACMAGALTALLVHRWVAASARFDR